MVGNTWRDQQLNGVKSYSRRNAVFGRPLGGLVVILALGFSLSAKANPHLERGIKLLSEFEEKKALKVLEHALTWSGNDDAIRAKIYLYQGIAYFELLKKADATTAFRKALETDKTVVLPTALSPKIRDLFSSVRVGLGGETVDPDPPPTSQPTSQPGPQDVKHEHGGHGGKGGKATDRPPPKAGFSFTWPTWVCAGIAVAAAAAAVGLGVAGQSKGDEARDPSIPYNDAVLIHDQAKGLVTGANVMIGVGSAAVVGAVVFFVLDWMSPPQVTAGVGPTSGGAILQLQGRF